MEIGVKLSEELIISLLDTKDNIVDKLDENEIRYKIHKTNDRELILMIPEYETELKIDNNKVSFIRSPSSEYTQLFQLSECNKNMTVHKYQDRITDKILGITKAERYKLAIESVNLRTLCSSVYCKCSNTESKLGIARDGHGNVFIQTIKLIRELEY